MNKRSKIIGLIVDEPGGKETCPSKVLQTISRLFGKKPFTPYRQRCVDKSIRSFLEDFSVSRPEESESNISVLCPSTA